MLIFTLLGLSGGEKISERLGFSQVKGENESEKLLISSKDASETMSESTSLVAEEKGEVEREVSQDEILMKEKRDHERNIGTNTYKSFIFAKELSEELVKELGGVEGPRLPSIPKEGEDSDDANSMDSTQRELDNISREEHEFTHPIPAYQVLTSKSNSEAEQTLGLVHSE